MTYMENTETYNPVETIKPVKSTVAKKEMKETG